MAAAKKKLTTWQKVLVITIAVIVVFCVGICSWYAYIRIFYPDKIISNTYEVGLQETTSGDAKPFIEVQYFTNENKNGLETFEIKFNYLLDEKQEHFYSQGLQFVADNKSSSIGFEYLIDESQTQGEEMGGTSGWYTGSRQYAYYGTYRTKSGASTFNYMSQDDYENTSISSNPLSTQSAFKIQLGDDLFLMKFKGDKIEKNELSFQYSEKAAYKFYLVFGYDEIHNYYTYSDPYFFSYLIFNSMESVSNGVNHNMVFEFGDLFNYYLYDENSNSYSDTEYKNMDSVLMEMQSYYSIRVTKSADGLQSAEDSLFKTVKGNSGFNLNGDYSSGDYFTGEAVFTADIYDFDFVKVLNDSYVLKFKDSFIETYKNFKNTKLNIEIDLDILKNLNIQFAGFADDSGLENFKINKIYTLETVDGQVVKTEITEVAK